MLVCEAVCEPVSLGVDAKVGEDDGDDDDDNDEEDGVARVRNSDDSLARKVDERPPVLAFDMLDAGMTEELLLRLLGVSGGVRGDFLESLSTD